MVIEQAQPAARFGGETRTEAVPVLAQRHTGDRLVSLLFLAPAVLFLLLTSVYPLLYSLWLSFHSWNMTIPNSRPVWFGGENYHQLLVNPAFLNSLRITLIFVASAVTVEFILGMGLALLITSGIRAMGLVRTVMLFPLMIAPVIAGVLWRTLYHPTY